MEKIEKIENALINSEFKKFYEMMVDYHINSFDSNGNNILHYFLLNCGRVNIEPKLILDLFIKKGIDINQKQSKGQFQRSPLHIAVLQKQQEITDYLINHGADVNSTDADGNNILSTAISRFNFGENGGYFIKKIIETGGNINQENNHGISAKTWALRYNEKEDARKYIPDSLLE